jgi:hypothetical protein
MNPLEQLLVALAAAIARAIVPLILQQIQTPSKAQDGYSDPDLQARLADAVEHPSSAD